VYRLDPPDSSPTPARDGLLGANILRLGTSNTGATRTGLEADAGDNVTLDVSNKGPDADASRHALEAYVGQGDPTIGRG
jgi:hypothetical protein